MWVSGSVSGILLRLPIGTAGSLFFLVWSFPLLTSSASSCSAQLLRDESSALGVSVAPQISVAGAALSAGCEM